MKKPLLVLAILPLFAFSQAACRSEHSTNTNAVTAPVTQAAAAPTAPTASAEIPERSTIAAKYKWNMTDLYATNSDWEKEFNWIQTNIVQFKGFEGKLASSPDVLWNCLQLKDEIDSRGRKLEMYASMSSDLDKRDQKYTALADRAEGLMAKVSSATAYIVPEILSLGESRVAEIINQKPEFKLYKHIFDDLFRQKAHKLSTEQEGLLALSEPVSDTFETAFGIFTNAEMNFPTVKDDKGLDSPVSSGRYGQVMYNPDRAFRERFYKALYVPYEQNKGLLAALFSGYTKDRIFRAQARHFEKSIEEPLEGDNIPLSVYDNLISATHKNLPILHRWAKVRKEKLGYSELHPYDVYVTMFPGSDKKYTFEEAKDIVIIALAPLGEQYITDLKKGLEGGWIDVFENKGKRSGAYSTSTKGAHPFILLNWQGELNDVFTLAHELGHSMHSYYTEKTQPTPYADYPIFLAEIASITNETLLMDYLLKQATTPAEKLALLEKQLIDFDTTFFRQARFAEFEKIVREKAEHGESLSPDLLAKTFADLYQEYWGPDMKTDVQEGYSWARIPHFYYNFYVFQYATGKAAALDFATKIVAEGKPAVDRYLEFLSSGKSAYPLDILKKAGVDMTTPDPVNTALSKMNSLLTQMESLSAKH